MSTYTRKIPLPFFATFYPFCCEEPYEPRLQTNSPVLISAATAKPNLLGLVARAFRPNRFLASSQPSRAHLEGQFGNPLAVIRSSCRFIAIGSWTHIRLTVATRAASTDPRRARA